MVFKSSSIFSEWNTAFIYLYIYIKILPFNLEKFVAGVIIYEHCVKKRHGENIISRYNKI